MLRRPRNPLPSLPPSLTSLSSPPSFLPLFSLLRCRLQRYYDPTSPQISRPARQVPNVLTFSNFAKLQSQSCPAVACYPHPTEELLFALPWI